LVTDGGWGFFCPICNEEVNCTFEQANNYIDSKVTTCNHLKRKKKDD